MSYNDLAMLVRGTYSRTYSEGLSWRASQKPLFFAAFLRDPVAQRIERLPSKQDVGGSSPPRVATTSHIFEIHPPAVFTWGIGKTLSQSRSADQYRRREHSA